MLISLKRNEWPLTWLKILLHSDLLESAYQRSGNTLLNVIKSSTSPPVTERTKYGIQYFYAF